MDPKCSDSKIKTVLFWIGYPKKKKNKIKKVANDRDMT